MKIKTNNIIDELPNPQSWEFVEMFYPDYHRSDDILLEDQLHQVVTLQMTVEEFNKKNDTQLTFKHEAVSMREELERDIYYRAYLSFIEKLISRDIELMK